MDQDFDIAPPNETVEETVFRVLSGPQTGAEMVLRPGTYVLGDAEDADIVLTGGALAPHHMTIHVDAHGVTLAPHTDIAVNHGGIFLDASDGDEITLEQSAAVLVGTLHIGLGPSNAHWTDLELPSPRQPTEDTDEDGSNETPEETDDADITVSDAEDDQSDKEDAQSDESAPGDLQEPLAHDAKTASEPKKTARRRKAALLLSAVVVGAMLFTGLANILSNDFASQADGTPAVEETVETPAAKAQSVFDRLGITSMSLRDVPNVGLVVSGLAENKAQKSEVITELSAAGIEFTDHIRTADQLTDAVQRTLENFTWPAATFADHLSVTHVGGGNIQIEGFLGPEVEKSTLQRRILSDVPGITGLRFVKSDLRDWEQDLVQRISDAQLSDWLTVSRSGASLRVEGELSQGQVKTWANVGESFTAASGGWPEIEIGVTALPGFVQDTGPKLASPPSEVSVPDIPDVLTEDMLDFPMLELTDLARLPEVEHILGSAADTLQSAQTTPSKAPVLTKDLPDDIKVIGVVTSSNKGSIALLADGTSVRIGDVLSTGEVVQNITLKGITATAGDIVVAYKI